MNNIKTKEDVLAWAKIIMDGKGEKYIPLGKADMFAIAKYVVVGPENLNDELKDVPLPMDDTEEKGAEAPSASKAVGVAAEDKKPTIEENPADTFHTSGCTSTTGGKTSTTATMTRSYALHRAGFTVQQAYDKFLKWCNDHPKEASVMDFRTGVKSANAAFAYWLSEIISVEVPTTTTACI